MKPCRPGAHIVVVDGVGGAEADIDEIVATRGVGCLDAIQQIERLEIIVVFAKHPPVIDVRVRSESRVAAIERPEQESRCHG